MAGFPRIADIPVVSPCSQEIRLAGQRCPGSRPGIPVRPARFHAEGLLRPPNGPSSLLTPYEMLVPNKFSFLRGLSGQPGDADATV